jgi:hypothetical protein
MKRCLTRALAAIVFAGLAATSLSAAEERSGVYQDPLGRYRFLFKGAWRVGANEEDPDAPNHYYLVKRGRVAAELIVSSRTLAPSSKLSDVVQAEIEAIDADPNMQRASLTTDLHVSGRPATRLIAHLVEPNAQGRPRERLAVQYWFIKGRELWSLLILMTPAEEQRSKLVSELERTLVASFEVLEPDEVARAIASSKKVARLGSGLAELTVPERWTLLKIEQDVLAAEFDVGRLYLFAVTDQELGETLKAIAHAFLDGHAALDEPEIKLEGECDVRGTPGYFIIFDGKRDGRLFRVQLIAVRSGADAFFLYGLSEVDAWPMAHPWITAAQYTIKLIEKPPVPPGAADENAD